MISKEEKLAAFADSALVPSQLFSYFEGWTDEKQQLQTRAGKLSLHQITEFLHHSHEHALPHYTSATGRFVSTPSRFRVISFPRLENGRLKLGFMRETYERLKESWHLHDLTLEVFLNNNGILSKFESANTTSILMKVPASRSVGFDCVSVAHDPINNITNVLYHSLADEDGIFDTLHANPERCLQPEFFAAILYQCHQQRVERHRNTIDDAIKNTECETKLGGPGRLFGHRYKHEEPTVEIHADTTAKRLSYIQTELAVIGHIARFSVQCGDWCVGLLENSKMQAADENDRLDAVMQILDEVEYTRRRSMTVLPQLQGVKERVQSQATLVSIPTKQTARQ